MKKAIVNSSIVSIIILLTLALASCGGGGTPGSGTLELSLTDGTGSFQAVYVTINEVQVHHETDGWITLTDLDITLPQTLNLLDLVNGTMAYLGAAELDAGHYTQMRLILDDSDTTPLPPLDVNILGNPHPSYNYLIDWDDNEILLTVPSGGTTGVKLVGGFDIESGGSTELVLDFDVLKSVVEAGNTDKWLLKPTIKVLDTITNLVSGMVLDIDGGQGLEGATLSAQLYAGDITLEDENDRVIMESSTSSAEQGNYRLYLPLSLSTQIEYNIVAVRDGYAPECHILQWSGPDEYSDNFNLTALAEDPAIFTASVQGLGSATASAHVSIRQDHLDCGVIEIASFNVLNTLSGETPIESEPILLPAGDYKMVVTAEGQLTKDEDFSVVSGEIVTRVIDFF